MKTIIIDDDELSGKVVEHYLSKTGFAGLVHNFTDPIKALSYISENKIDLVLLDIEMPEMNGMEMINAIKNSSCQIILVTSHKEFAIEAFEYQVVDYLVKPFTYPRFFKAIAAAKQRISEKANNDENDFVFVKKDSKIIQIRKSEILWVEAMGDYAVLNTAKEKFILHSTLKAIGEKLPEQNYIRVHRSYIVRMDKIDKIEDDTIFCNSKTIPIGKSYHEEVFRKLKMF
jgi:DNA-binding LytR/AlgR family response regulator